MVSCSKIKKNNFNSLFFQLYIILSIFFCCSLFSIQASELRSDLEEGERFVTEVRKYVGSFKPEVFKNKDLFFLLGPSRAGKSTILNLLAGKNLSAKRDECGLWQIDGAGVIAYIGHGASETILPNYWADDKGTFFFDSPGFNDTRGSEYDIARAYILSTVGKNAKNVKFSIVSSMDSIQQQDGRLTDTINQLKGFIPSFKVEDSVIIATKADSDLNETHVVNSLKRQRFSCFKAVIFHKPSQAGRIDGSSITTSIYSAPSFPSNKNLFSISLSDKTVNYINALISNLNKTIIGNDVCGGLYKDFSNHCSNLINTHLGSADDLRRELSKVSIKGEKFNTKEDIIGILDFTGKLKNKNLFSRIIEVLNYIQLVTDLSEDSIHSWTQNSIIQKILEGAKRDIIELTKLPEVNKYGQYLTIKGFIIGAEDVHQVLSKYYGEQISEINLYCLNSMFIDADISAQGVNLILTSPQWRVVGKRTINLEGKEGAAYKYEKANNGISYGENGKDGSPGTPGLPGGHFYGKGKEFTNLSSLTINVSGGTGGKGQNGGNGAEGIPGGNGGLEDVKNGKELISRTKITAESYGDYIEKGFKFFLTFNDKFKEVYESYEPGKQGGNAGIGGRGGLGGKPGSVTIENPILLQKSLVLQKDGDRGSNGSDGNPGVGGRNGPRYRGVYISEMVAPGIRGYKEIETDSLAGTTAGTGAGALAGAGLASATAQAYTLESCKVVVKKGVETIVSEATKTVYKEGSKIVINQAGKEVASGVVKGIAANAGKAVVTVGTSTASAMAQGMGTGLLVQAVLSPVSSFFSSGWEQEPYLASYDTGRASPGIIPISYNELGIKDPSVTNLSSLSEKEKSYNNFVSEKEKDFSKYIIKF